MMRSNQHHLLLNELNHRIQNLLAVMQSVIHFSLVGGGTIKKAVIKQRLIGRLQAVSNANRAVMETPDGGIRLIDLISSEIRGLESQFDITSAGGLILSPRLTLNLLLILNELVANARRYGSLSVPYGRVKLRIDWTSSTLSLDWQELHGPPVVPPKSTGFGGQILGTFARRFCDEVDMRYADGGFSYRIRFRSDQITCSENKDQPAASSLPAAQDAAGACDDRQR